MYERLITDGGLLSTPPCTVGTGWNSMELWLQLTVMYCCWVHSTWKQMSWSTFKWIREAGATGAANSISLHQAQLCLNIFSKRKLLKGAVLGIFLELMPFILCRGMSLPVYQRVAGLLWRWGWGGESGKGEFHWMLWVGVGRRYLPPCLSLGGGLLPAEERTLLVSIGSHVAGQLDDGGGRGMFSFL